jgi:Trypsin
MHDWACYIDGAGKNACHPVSHKSHGVEQSCRRPVGQKSAVKRSLAKVRQIPIVLRSATAAFCLGLAAEGTPSTVFAQNSETGQNAGLDAPATLAPLARDPLEGLPITVTPDYLPPVILNLTFGAINTEVCYSNRHGKHICRGDLTQRRGVRYYRVEPGVLAWQAQIFVASVRGGWQNQHWCGGSLIDEGWVLTAAHCTRDGANAMNDVGVRLGAFDLAAGDGAIYRIDRVIVHANYKRGEKPNDIALLHVVPDKRPGTTPVYRVAAIPIVRPSTNGMEQLQIGQPVRTSGWGRTSENGVLMQQLGETKLRLMANQQCRSIYGDKFSDRALCAYAPDTDSCEGDSGGPLTQLPSDRDIRKVRLIGIVSFGRGCAEPGVPGVYTRVESYFDWIQEAKTRTERFFRLPDPPTRQSVR